MHYIQFKDAVSSFQLSLVRVEKNERHLKRAGLRTGENLISFFLSPGCH